MRHGYGPSGPLGMAVEIPPQRPWRPAGLAVADRAVVDANHRHDDLAGGRHKGLARRISLRDGEWRAPRRPALEP